MATILLVEDEQALRQLLRESLELDGYRVLTAANGEEHLATATAMYRTMGMSFWLEKAEAVLGPPPRNSL